MKLDRTRLGWRRILAPLLPLAPLLVGIAVPSVAVAAVSPRPAWHVTEIGGPTVVTPSTPDAFYYVIIENVGGATSEGSFKLRVQIPDHFSVQSAFSKEQATCHAATAGEETCEFSGAVLPGGMVGVRLNMKTVDPAGDLASTAVVSGGGAATSARGGLSGVRLGKEHETAPAGISLLSFDPTGPAGEPVTQAGGHPTLLSASFYFNNTYAAYEESHEGGRNEAGTLKPVQSVKDLIFYLPLGMLGNTTVAEQCQPTSINITYDSTGCPPASQVGTIAIAINGEALANGFNPWNGATVWQIEPERGFVAAYAFTEAGIPVTIYANVVWHDGAYAVRVAAPGVGTFARLLGATVTFFGDLQDANPDGPPVDRGNLLTNPSVCGPVARQASVVMNTWEELTPLAPVSVPAFTSLQGCGLLQFGSNLSASPDVRAPGDTTQADEPSGYKVDLHIPQAPNLANVPATPPVQAVRFTLPAGTSLSPGAANGLTACAASGPRGIDFPNGEGKPGSPGEPAGEGEVEGPDGLPQPSQGHCPSSSIVGVVHARTPLLAEEFGGHLYLAEPGCGNAAHPNPCTPQDAADGNLYRLYLELEAPERGVIVKLAGSAHVDPTTGQVTAVFEGVPQFPIEDATVETTGGPRASLANPQSCGTATTTGVVSPWSGGAPSTPSGSFTVDWDGEGGACPATDPFAPALSATTGNAHGGEYSPFTLTLKREDGEQDLGSLSARMPPGLLAAVSHVAKCPEPQAAQGGCPASSRVGSTTVAVGSGEVPFVQGGTVYFTGPYDGAPFGLSVVVPAVAGPFNLGDVIVRVALFVDPHTAQVTAVSGPLPQIIDGVPLRFRTIGVTLDAPQFTLNPTSCAAMAVTGTATSTQGTQAAVSSPFTVQGCSSLPFKPSFRASTQGSTSRKNGASLVVTVSSGAGQANIGQVHVSLPRALPSRDSTLKLACLQRVFEADPAACPEGSNVGVARAATPILKEPLLGPAYLVSHGGAAFPDLEIVLQGEGVQLILDGKTNIKNGVTSSSFDSVPDAPVSSFELKLPEGPHSILAAPVGKLCQSKLTMPTSIVGHNGATVKQTTKITVTGCAAKHKARKTSRTHRKKR